MAAPERRYSMADVMSEVREWAQRTDAALLRAQQRNNVGITRELYNSVRNEVVERGTDIRYELSFLRRGRFVDMGAGRGVPRRVAKKWYSRIFYGRLSALQGVVSARIAEEALRTIRNSMRNEQTPR